MGSVCLTGFGGSVAKGRLSGWLARADRRRPKKRYWFLPEFFDPAGEQDFVVAIEDRRPNGLKDFVDDTYELPDGVYTGNDCYKFIASIANDGV